MSDFKQLAKAAVVGLLLGAVATVAVGGKLAWDQRNAWAQSALNTEGRLATCGDDLQDRTDTVAQLQAEQSALAARLSLAHALAEIDADNYGAAREQIRSAARFLKTAPAELRASSTALAVLTVEPGNVPVAELEQVAHQLDSALSLQEEN